MIYEILRATETHNNPVANQARINHRLTDEDIVLVFRYGRICELYGIGGIAAMTGTQPQTIEAALAVCREYKNGTTDVGDLKTAMAALGFEV